MSSQIRVGDWLWKYRFGHRGTELGSSRTQFKSFLQWIVDNLLSLVICTVNGMLYSPVQLAQSQSYIIRVRWILKSFICHNVSTAFAICACCVRCFWTNLNRLFRWLDYLFSHFIAVWYKKTSCNFWSNLPAKKVQHSSKPKCFHALKYSCTKLGV